MVKRSKYDLANPRYMKVPREQFLKLHELHGEDWAEQVRDVIAAYLGMRDAIRGKQ